MAKSTATLLTRASLATPAILVTIPLLIILVVQGAILVTHREVLTQPGSGELWAGWSNFSRAFADPNLVNSVRVTLVYAIAGVGLEMVIGVGIALLLTARIPGRGVVRALILIPMVITPVVAGLTWRLLMDPTAGTLNYLLGVIGLGSDYAFLGDPVTALPAVIAVEIWQNTPFVVIIALAGLESLDPAPLEAAQLDGASGWSKVRHVVLPMISPVLAIIVLLRLIDAVKTFPLINAMTQGGPGSSTMALSNYVYQLGFQTFEIGYATTVGVLVSLAIVVVLFPVAARLMGLRLLSGRQRP